jgi:hypothetical protein
VEFYFYSPQWSGNPTDIALKNTEEATSTASETTGNVIITNIWF